MFSNNAIATIWKAEDKGNYHECQISTQGKRKDGSKETDFSAFVRFVGRSHNLKPQAKQRIKILSCGVSNNYDKDKKITYTNYTIFDYELCDAQPQQMVVDEEDLPFL